MSCNIIHKIDNFNTKIINLLVPATDMSEKVAKLDRVGDQRTKRYNLRSVYRDKQTRDKVMKILYDK